MIKQASIAQIRSGEINVRDGRLVVVMRYYPRGLRRALFQEYRSDLAPDRVLFKDWKSFERTNGHDEAFVRSNYENRFQLSQSALEYLHELSALARKEDVYFACQCRIGEMCHREMLMILCRERYAAPIDRIFHHYGFFRQRIEQEFL